MLPSFVQQRRPQAAFLLCVAFCVLVPFILLSCKGHTVVSIPTGTQTLTGVLLPVPISLSRRGTHSLAQQGTEIALVESSSVNLREMEGVDVVVTGHFERNTDPNALPVLVASGVTLVNMQMRTWQLPALNVSIDTPLDWNPQFSPQGVRFNQTGSTTVLALSTGALAPLPSAQRMTVGGRPAAFVSASGATIVYVHNGSSLLLLEFSRSIPGGNVLVTRIIRTLRFVTPDDIPSSQAASGSTSPLDAGSPCGGPAGILCLSGQYCEITDAVSNIGRCRAVQR